MLHVKRIRRIHTRNLARYVILRELLFGKLLGCQNYRLKCWFVISLAEQKYCWTIVPINRVRGTAYCVWKSCWLLNWIPIFRNTFEWLSWLLFIRREFGNGKWSTTLREMLFLINPLSVQDSHVNLCTLCESEDCRQPWWKLFGFKLQKWRYKKLSWCPIDVRLVDIQITRNQFPELNGQYVNCLGRTPTCELVGSSAEETNPGKCNFSRLQKFL